MTSDTKLHLIHGSYHKCLTVYFGRIMHAVFNRCLPWSSGYRHYNSHLEDFYDGFHTHRIASINNRALDLERLGRFRISRFIRDPRDLVVSGYFYHKRGSESWLTIESPTETDWYFANGRVPEALRATGSSFAQYLQSIPKRRACWQSSSFAPCTLSPWPAGPPSTPTSSPTATRTLSAMKWRCSVSCSSSTGWRPSKGGWAAGSRIAIR